MDVADHARTAGTKTNLHGAARADGVVMSRDHADALKRDHALVASMKYVVLGEGAGASMDALMKVYPRHKAFVDGLTARGLVVGTGPFADRGGNMGIFRTRAAAEEYVAGDPFKLEGLIKSYIIREWNDSMIE